MRSQQHLSLLGPLIMICCIIPTSVFTLHAQDTDPFAIKSIDRASASLPVPYGFIASGNGCVLGLKDEDIEPTINFGVDVYYDTWQLGFHREQYGNVLRLMTRSVGRDFVNYGFFVHAGWITEDTFSITQFDPAWYNSNYPPDSAYKQTGTKTQSVFGGGYRYGSGYSNGTSFIWAIEVSASNIHIGGAIPLGLRVPFNRQAVHISLTPSIIGQSVRSLRGHSNMRIILGLYLSAKYALNYEI